MASNSEIILVFKDCFKYMFSYITGNDTCTLGAVVYTFMGEYKVGVYIDNNALLKRPEIM